MTDNSLISQIAKLKGITEQDARNFCEGKTEKQIQSEISALQEKLQKGLSNAKPKDISFKNFVELPDKSKSYTNNLWGNGFAMKDEPGFFELEFKPKEPVYSPAQKAAMEFLTGNRDNAEEIVTEREKEAGPMSACVNAWQEIFNKELSKSNVKQQIQSTNNDITALQKAANGEYTRFDAVVGDKVKISFEEIYKKQRGVKFDENAIADCQEKSETYIRAKQVTSMVNEVKMRLKSTTTSTLNNNLSPEKASGEIIKALKLCGVNSLKDMNEVLKNISQEQKNHPDVKKYGGDFRLSKNKNGKYCIYRTDKSGFPAEAATESLKVIAEQVTLKLNKVYASALGSEIPENVTNDELEAIAQNKYNEYQKEYENAFAKAYGKKDLKALSERYVEAQQKGVENIELGINILSTAAMLLPGAQVGAANWALKGSIAAKNSATLGKFARAVSLVDKAKTGVKTAQTIAKVTQKLSPVIMTNMIARPTYLIEQLFSENGMSKEEWEQWGTGVLQNSTYMAAGMGVAKLAEQAGALYKTKKLVDALKTTGHSADEISAMIKANPVKFPNDIVSSFAKINNTAKALQISTEVTADLASTYAINKALGNGDLQTQDWANSLLFAINGSVLQKQFAPLSKEGKADFLMNAFKDYGMTKNDAFNVLKTMDDISSGKVKAKVKNPKSNTVNHNTESPKEIYTAAQEPKSKMAQIQEQKLKELAEQNKTYDDFDFEDDGIYGYSYDGHSIREDMRTRMLMNSNLADEQFTTKSLNSFSVEKSDHNEIYNTISKPLINKNGQEVRLYDNIAPIFGNSVRGKTPLSGNPKNVNFKMKKLKQGGINAVIDLRAPNECSQKIKDTCKNNDIEYINIPIDDMNWSQSQIAYIPKFIKAMNEGKNFVGCANGEARTDLAMAINYICNPKQNEIPPFYFGNGSSGRVSISNNMNLIFKNLDESTIKELGWASTDEFKTETLKRFKQVLVSLGKNPDKGLELDKVKSNNISKTPDTPQKLPNEEVKPIETTSNSMQQKVLNYPELLENVDNPEKLHETILNIINNGQYMLKEYEIEYSVKNVINKDNVQAFDMILSKRPDLGGYFIADIIKNIDSTAKNEYLGKILDFKLNEEPVFGSHSITKLISDDINISRIKGLDLISEYSKLHKNDTSEIKLYSEDIVSNINEHNIDVIELLFKKHSGESQVTFVKYGETTNVDNILTLNSTFKNLISNINSEDTKKFVIDVINKNNYYEESYNKKLSLYPLSMLTDIYNQDKYLAEKIIQKPNYQKNIYNTKNLSGFLKENIDLYFEISDGNINAELVKDLTPELRKFVKAGITKMIDNDLSHKINDFIELKNSIVKNPESLEIINTLMNRTDKLEQRDIPALADISLVYSNAKNTLKSLKPVLEEKNSPIKLSDIAALCKFAKDKPIDEEVITFIKNIRQKSQQEPLAQLIENLYDVSVYSVPQDKLLKFYNDVFSGKTAMKGEHSTFAILSQTHPVMYDFLNIISTAKNPDGTFRFNEESIAETLSVKPQDFGLDRVLPEKTAERQMLVNNAPAVIDLKNSDGTPMIALKNLKYVCKNQEVCSSLINNLPPEKNLGAVDFYERSSNSFAEKLQEFGCKNFKEFEEKISSFSGAERAKAGKLLGEIKKNALDNFTEGLPPEFLSAFTGPTGSFTAKDFDNLIKTINENPFLRKSLDKFNETGKLDLTIYGKDDAEAKDLFLSLILKDAQKLNTLKQYNELISNLELNLNPKEFQKKYETVNKLNNILFTKIIDTYNRILETHPELKADAESELHRLTSADAASERDIQLFKLIDFLGEGNTSGIIHNENLRKIESYSYMIAKFESTTKIHPEHASLVEKISNTCKLPGVKDNDLKKLLNISKGLVDIDKMDVLNNILDNNVKNNKVDIVNMTKDVYKVIGQECGIDDTKLNNISSDDINKWDIEYLPFIITAIKSLENSGKPEDSILLKKLVNTTLDGSYKEFLFDSETPNGKLNIESREIFKDNNLNFDEFMEFKGEQKFAFTAKEVDASPIIKSTIEDLGILSKNSAAKTSLSKFLSENKIQFTGEKLLNSTGQELSKKELLGFISNINKYLSENKKVLETAGIGDICDHFVQRKRALGKTPIDKKAENMTIALWKRDPHHDLFQGHYCQCCVSLDGINKHAMVESLSHTVDQIGELKNSNGETVGKVKLLFIKDTQTNEPALLANGFEIVTDYQFDNGIRDKFVDFMKEYSKAVAGKEIPIYTGTTYQKINYDDLSDLKGNFQLLGKTPGNKYHLDSYSTTNNGDSHPQELDKPKDLILKVMYKPN